MILNKTVILLIKNRNDSFLYYQKLGYDIQIFKNIEIRVEDLLPGNKSILQVQCDECGKQDEIQNNAYISNIKKHGKYMCYACSYKKSMLEKYGVINASQLNR